MHIITYAYEMCRRTNITRIIMLFPVLFLVLFLVLFPVLFLVLFPAISWGDSPQNPKFPPQKNTKNTKKNIEECIEFTPRYVFSPKNLGGTHIRRLG